MPAFTVMGQVAGEHENVCCGKGTLHGPTRYKLRKNSKKGAPDQQSGAPFLALTAIFFNISVLALDDDLDGFLAAEDVADDGLLALQALVDAEEVADFACHMVRQLRDVLV